MSLLDEMRALKRELQAERHPLSDLERRTRYAYLVGIAVGGAVDGPVSEAERKILLDLSFSLRLPESDCEKAAEEAAHADKQTLRLVLESVGEGERAILFLADLRRMIETDGPASQQEEELWTLFAETMDIEEDARNFLSKNHDKNYAEILRVFSGKGYPPSKDGGISVEKTHEEFSSGACAETREVTNQKDGSVFVLVPEGDFEMGDGRSPDCPKHRVWLDSYYIGKYCVTNAQYARFIKETGHRPPNNDSWNTLDKSEHPVTDISWLDAMAYAKWAGCDLPMEAQWEKATRGPNGYVYPWGNEWDGTKCRNNTNRGGETTAPVDAFPADLSEYGICQQAGNVCEWCSDWYYNHFDENPGKALNPNGPSKGSKRVTKGGSWANGDPWRFRGAHRFKRIPFYSNGNIGFRLAKRP